MIFAILKPKKTYQTNYKQAKHLNRSFFYVSSSRNQIDIGVVYEESYDQTSEETNESGDDGFFH